MNENVVEQHEQTDTLNDLVNPDWNKVSYGWMAVAFTSFVYGIVNPSIEVLFATGILFMLLSFIAYKAGKKNNGGS